MSDAWVMALQAVVVAAISLLASYLVAKISKRATDEQTDVDAQANATKAWESYSARLEKRLESLEGRFEEAEKRHEEDRRRIRSLERQRESDRDLIRRLVFRLRWALGEIRRLGGTVPEQYDTIANDAATRLDLD